MRRTWWFNPLATLLTLWLPLIIGEPSLLQPCPTHGAAVVASAATANAHQASANGQQHTAHHAASADSADHGSAPDHQHANCSCIGCCTGSPAITPNFGAPIATVVVATYTAAPPPVEAAALPRPAPEYARPYNTGPPRV